MKEKEIKGYYRKDGTYVKGYIYIISEESEKNKRKKLSIKSKENRTGECMCNHPNSIKTRFKKGKDDRRTGGRNFSKETRKKLAKRMSEMASKQTGENHPRWKGGVGGKVQLIRNSQQHKDWSMEVYKRDKFACQDCGKHCRKGDIIAHHINEFCEFEEERFDVSNGTTFCRSCHVKFHNRKRKLNRLKVRLILCQA